MSEDLSIFVGANGVVQTSNGLRLTGQAIEDLGKKADLASPAISRTAAAVQDAGVATRVLPAALSELTGLLGGSIPAWLNIATTSTQAGAALSGTAADATATAGAIGALAVPLAAAAVAAAVLTAGYAKAREEQWNYAQAVIFTGNASGVTTDELHDMARAIDQVRGTESQAAVALAQFTATGRIGREELQRFSEQAIRMEQVTGKSVEETVRQFAALADSPLKGSVRLNESLNYLTRSTYEQIKALVAAGKETEAARVAMTALADANDQRLPLMERNITNLSWAWRGVKAAVLETGDAIVGVFRADSLSQQIKKAEEDLAKFDGRKVNIPAVDGPRRAAMVERIGMLKQQRDAEVEAAQRQGADAVATRDWIATQEKKTAVAHQVHDASAALADQIARRMSLAQAELASEGKLTEAERFRVDMLREIAEIQDKISAARAAGLRQQVEVATRNIAALELQRESLKQQEEVHREFIAARQQATQAAEREVAQLQQSLAALQGETAEIGLNSDALYNRKQALLDDAISEKQAHLARIEGLADYTDQATAIQQQIALLQDLKAARAENFIKAYKADEDKANQQRTEAIAQSIEDGILEGFRGSRKIADVFLTELKAQFARTVLRVPIQHLAQSGSDLFTNLLKLGATMLPGAGVGLGSNPAGYNGTLNNISAFIPIPGSHEGGVPGRGEATFVRSMPAEAFAGAQRFHSGIGPDELPAIITKKEGVFTEGQMRAMAPVSEIAKAGGRSVTFAPQIYIDSRTDKAEIMGLLNRGLRAAQADLLDKMNRGQV